jgi:hypothetical protein
LHKITLEVVFLLTPPLPCQQGISACGAAIKSVKVLNSTHYTASQTGIEKMCLSTVKKNPGTSYLDGQKKGQNVYSKFFQTTSENILTYLGMVNSALIYHGYLGMYIPAWKTAILSLNYLL